MNILDLFWPRNCAICGRLADRPGRHLCSDCLMRLDTVPTQGNCRRCGRVAEALDREYLCQECREHRPAFDRAAAVLHYEGENRKLVKDFKFHRHWWLLPDFADLLEATVRARFRTEEIAFIVPMPASWWHRWDRGLNAPDYLARALAKRLGKPCRRGLIRRKGFKPRPQVGLSAEERRKNIKGAFALTRKGRRVLAALPPRTAVMVVDDVMTTGATLAECARTLKTTAPLRIWTLALATAT